MVSKPISKRVSLDRLLSENDLCQSWMGRDLSDNRQRFIKVSSLGRLDQAVVGDTMAVSYNCQKKLGAHSVNRALRSLSEHGRTMVVYRYLDPEQWSPVDACLFKRRSREILFQICLTVDFLHLAGVVHRDLKLGNFLCLDRDGLVRVVLADLDFLAPAYTPMNACLFGTPGLIAPEVLRNEPFSPRSDNYSLGVSIRGLLEELQDIEPVPRNGDLLTCDGLRMFADRLTREEAFERPHMLIDELHSLHLISEQQLGDFNNRLLQNRLLAALREIRAARYSFRASASTFFTERIGLFGLHPELCEDIQTAIALNPKRTLWAARDFIRNAQLKRFSDKWSLLASDESIAELLAKLNSEFGLALAAAESEPSSTGRGSKSNSPLLSEEDGNEEPLKAYVLLKKRAKRLSGSCESGKLERVSVYRRLASLGAALARHTEIEIHLTELLENLDETDNEYLDSLLHLVLSQIRQGKDSLAKETISRGLTLSERTGSPKHQLEFSRHNAWMLSVDGQHDKALEELRSIAKRAEENGFYEVCIRALHSAGVACWRAGRFEAAEEYLSQSIRLAKERDCVHASSPAMETIAMLYFEIADYERSERFHKLTLKHSTEPADAYMVPHVCVGLMNTSLRLAKHGEARQWNQRYLAALPPNQSEAVFGRFYFNEGWISLMQGELAMASEALHIAADALTPLGNSRNLGKAYYDLAELALYQGDRDAVKLYAGQATDVFTKLGDSASLSDVVAIEAMSGCYYDNNSCAIDTLVSAIETQLDRKSWYAACTGMVHLILMKIPIPMSIIDKAGPLLTKRVDSRVPLFSAFDQLRMMGACGDHSSADIALLKSVYRIFNQAGHYFLAMLVCRRIADVCLEKSNSKLAQRFLAQALALSRRIRNRRFESDIQAKLSRINETDDTWRTASVFAKDLSSILTDIGDYQGTLDRILRFAVDKTGAERGVLLLKSDHASDLHIRSSLNCDDQSLNDVSDFSRTVARSTAEGFEPLVIANAIEDTRTSGYKSIVLHNILSVICMPIRRGGESTGVLYLDHHTIPALFDRGDIELITGIANLISLVLSAARELRQVRRSHAQLLEDLAHLGLRQSFVTRDPVMLSLLEKLPDIAKSDSSVLIFGESGTGKEILADMLHHLSLRKAGPLVKLNCSAIPDTLIESELFGMASKAATDVGEREGKFEAADGGTLFLDEIGDMPLAVQSKVLRIIEYPSFSRVGSNQTISADVRLVYATNKDLAQSVRDGSFRHDLFHRINKIYLEIPPLRDRLTDIPVLVEFFSGVLAGDKPVPRFSRQSMEKLLSYDWPGNVRELRNLVERRCIIHPGEVVNVDDLPKEMRTPPKRQPLSTKLREAEESLRIRNLLDENDWNQSKVARMLNMPLTTLRRKMVKYGIRRKP